MCCKIWFWAYFSDGPLQIINLSVAAGLELGKVVPLNLSRVMAPLDPPGYAFVLNLGFAGSFLPKLSEV